VRGAQRGGWLSSTGRTSARPIQTAELEPPVPGPRPSPHLVQRGQVVAVLLRQHRQALLIAQRLAQQVRRHCHDGHQRVVLRWGTGGVGWGAGNVVREVGSWAAGRKQSSAAALHGHGRPKQQGPCSTRPRSTASDLAASSVAPAAADAATPAFKQERHLERQQTLYPRQPQPPHPPQPRQQVPTWKSEGGSSSWRIISRISAAWQAICSSSGLGSTPAAVPVRCSAPPPKARAGPGPGPGPGASQGPARAQPGAAAAAPSSSQCRPGPRQGRRSPSSATTSSRRLHARAMMPHSGCEGSDMAARTASWREFSRISTSRMHSLPGDSSASPSLSRPPPALDAWRVVGGVGYMVGPGPRGSGCWSCGAGRARGKAALQAGEGRWVRTCSRRRRLMGFSSWPWWLPVGM
jgi:hypothetical protein